MDRLGIESHAVRDLVVVERHAEERQARDTREALVGLPDVLRPEREPGVPLPGEEIQVRQRAARAPRDAEVASEEACLTLLESPDADVAPFSYFES